MKPRAFTPLETAIVNAMADARERTVTDIRVRLAARGNLVTETDIAATLPALVADGFITAGVIPLGCSRVATYKAAR